MKTLILLSILSIMSNKTKYKIDFGKTSGVQDWRIVNDGVMGGLSQSIAIFTNNSVLFKGTVSLKNNGGFAMLRSPIGSFDLSNFKTVKIKFRSKGRDFSLRLATSELYFKPNYKHRFRSESEDWEIIELSLSDFQEFTLGRLTGSDISAENMKDILRIGIILNDKIEGPFEIEVDYIEFN